MSGLQQPARALASDQDGLRTRLLEWLVSREDEMAGLLAQLVAIPSVNPPGQRYSECAELLTQKLEEFGFDCEQIRVPPEELMGAEPRTALFATRGTGRRALYFHGHYDVVPAQSREQFVPQQRGRFLFGRGSCDMKGGIVAMLYAIRAVEECRIAMNSRIVLTLVPDEETGGKFGSAYLQRIGRLGQDGIGMLTAEPTSGAVWNASRGAISLRVRVKGKSAHVGLHYEGENAFERMHRVVAELLKLKRDVERSTTRYRIAPDRAKSSILMIGGQSAGGSNFNVVPEECWFTVDRRINPEEDLETEKLRLLDLLDGLRNDSVPLEVHVFQEARSCGCDETAPLGLALGKSIGAVTGQKARFELCPGLLEIRFYADKMPAYAYGPGLLSVAHGPNEYVDLRKVAECAAVYALTAANVLHP